jgi:hypothetical protein
LGHINSSYCLIGDQAIEIAHPLLETMSYNRQVNLLETGSRQIEELQRLGIDAMVWTRPGECYTVEIKGRLKDYGDIFLEKIQEGITKRVGWIEEIQSDFLLYTIIPTKTAHLLKFEALKAWYDLCGWLYEDKFCYKPNGKYSVGICIPWKDLRQNSVGLAASEYQVFDLKNNSLWVQKLQIMGIKPVETNTLRAHVTTQTNTAQISN